MDNTDKYQNAAADMAQKAKNAASDVSSEAVKSGKDWVHYIESHPLQSVFFMVIGYFALKGMMKS